MPKMHSALADEYQQFVAERIAELRKKRGLKASELSYSLGYSKSYVYNLENKVSDPSNYTLFCIMECLDVDPPKFFAPLAKDDTPKIDRDMMALFGDLSDEDKADVLKMVGKIKK